MRKNKLIELLQEIEGNPEVLSWNGMERDWMSLKTVVHKRTLCRMSLNKRLHYINLERNRDDLPPLESVDDIINDEPEEWQLDEFDAYDNSRLDQSKKVIMLEPKARGISTFDFRGGIEY